jgi:hypothetical protein
MRLRGLRVENTGNRADAYTLRCGWIRKNSAFSTKRGFGAHMQNKLTAAKARASVWRKRRKGGDNCDGEIEKSPNTGVTRNHGFAVGVRLVPASTFWKEKSST